MVDIAERLRDKGFCGCHPGDGLCTTCEAAEEITDLRALVATVGVEKDDLRARNAELLEALKRIRVAAEFHAQDGISDHASRYAHESTKRLADAAIKKAKGEG